MADAIKAREPTLVFSDPAGVPLPFMSKVDKRSRDILAWHMGKEYREVFGKKKKVNVTTVDLANPLAGRALKPGNGSPLCAQCQLDKCGARHPYLGFWGPDKPVVTVIFEGIGPKEDSVGKLAMASSNNMVYEQIADAMSKTGVDPNKDVRWLAVTQCYPNGSTTNFKTKANWCRYHVIQDLALHPPRLIMPVGTTALGMLSHKSSAQDWQGRLLTYRGWPDDWLTDPKFMLPRPHPLTGEANFIGHPVFGPPPPHGYRIPMWPVQTPRLVHYLQNRDIIRRWEKAIEDGITKATTDIQLPNYHRLWYRVSCDPQEVATALMELIENPGTIASYDTETTGLKQFDGQNRIVFHMFRWIDKAGQPKSIGFPWDYEGSELKPYMEDLLPYVWQALISCQLIAHNGTFDALFAAATMGPRDNAAVCKRINELAPCLRWDTWHEAYTLRQERGSLSLDMLAHKFVPDMANYEEEMTLMIALHEGLLDPAAGKGGHYANCPKQYWPSHFIPYVMGDVEVTYQAHGVIRKKLAAAQRYSFPLAHPQKREQFRLFTPPSREWVYDNIMAPANCTLTKMMARGMFVDAKKVEFFENHYPALINDARKKVAASLPVVEDWIKAKTEMPREAGDNKVWEFDLENKTVLKELVFKVLNLPIQRLTKSGKKKFGDKPEDIVGYSLADLYDYVAIDKYSLNKLAVDHPHVRCLLDYRKHYKSYTAFVKPLRNCFSDLVDKKHRDDDPHLCPDSCIHTSFSLCGTRGGRLNSSRPNLQQLPSKSSVSEGESEIKEMFTSRFGARGCIYSSDLSQIELRLLACACGDPSMVQAFKDNVDLHTLTTSKIYKQPYETFTKEYFAKLKREGKGDEAKKRDLQRRCGKQTNFLTGYGGGAFGLQTTLAGQGVYITVEECEIILQSFFDAYPTLKRFLGVYKSFIQSNACAVSMFGRVRMFEEVRGDDREAAAKALRAGCNHLIQATASDMMLICLVVIEGLMRDANLESMLVSTVHDSLVIDAVRAELPQVHEIVDAVMNHIPEVLQSIFGPSYDTSWIITPLAGDGSCGAEYMHQFDIVGKSPDWQWLNDLMDGKAKLDDKH